MADEGRVTLTDSVVSGNESTGSGGGIENKGVLEIAESTISANTAGTSGGGIASDGASVDVTLTRSTVSGNMAGTHGGGIALQRGVYAFMNSTISGNTATESAGGILSLSATDITYTNVTIAGNTSSSSFDGAMRIISGSATFENALVEGGCNNSVAITSNGGNLESPGNGCGFTDGIDQVSVTSEALGLGPLQDNGGLTETHALLQGSVAIDAALLDACPETDQRGVGRPLDGDGDEVASCDVGAFELEPPFPCTEQGILDAIDAGGGPHTFSCEGETTVTTSAEIVMDTDVTLDGGGKLTVDGGGTHRVFYVGSGVTAELRQMTVSRGNGEGSRPSRNGGGIMTEGVLTVTDSTISDNTAAELGGGIFASKGASATITNSTVSGNVSTFGGGGLVVDRGSVTLTNSVVSGNESSSWRGGGIQNFGVLVITDSTISGNTSFLHGGGISNESAEADLELTLTGSTVSGNMAGDDGGGISILSTGVFVLTNSTISGNETAEHGGGIKQSQGTDVTYTNVTIAGNTSSLPSTGAMWISSGSATFENTLVEGGCGSPRANSNGGNLESPGNGCGFTDGIDQVSVTSEALLLGPLQDNGGFTQTRALLEGSVAVDAALQEACPETDQRGIDRPFQGDGVEVALCDVGAFEYVPEPSLALLQLAAIGSIVALVRRRRRT